MSHKENQRKYKGQKKTVTVIGKYKARGRKTQVKLRKARAKGCKKVPSQKQDRKTQKMYGKEAETRGLGSPKVTCYYHQTYPDWSRQVC